MNNPRVYEVAKDIGMSSQELMDRLNEDGYSVTSNFNSVDSDMFKHIMNKYGEGYSERAKYSEDDDATKNETIDKGVLVEKESSGFKPRKVLVRYMPKKKKQVESDSGDKVKQSSDAAEQKNDEKAIEEKHEPRNAAAESLAAKEPDGQLELEPAKAVETSALDKPSQAKHKTETLPADSEKKNAGAEQEKPSQSEPKDSGDLMNSDRVKKDFDKAELSTAGLNVAASHTRTSQNNQSFSPSSQKNDKAGHNTKANKINSNTRGDVKQVEEEKKHVKKKDLKRPAKSDANMGESAGFKSQKKAKEIGKKVSKYQDGAASESAKSKSKNKKSKRNRNIIDETMRSELEKTDLNFGKKSQGKRRRKSKRSEEIVMDIENNEVVEDAAIKVKDRMTVHEFAELTGIATNDIILKLMNLGVMATINQYIDFEVMELVASDFDIDLEREDEKIDEAVLDYDFEDDEKDLQQRAPVVTVMGHVDHGKTSLLDAIRSTSVIDSEAGGITQHIGASEVNINGQKIVFLDTPGHEAFTSLRARGVQLTDIAILVVAADDGVMPQTIEAIDHAKAADVPIIVAINKIDKLGANPDQVIKELSEHGVLVEDWGGDTVSVKVSAKQNENIDALLEMVILVADMMELKANPNRNAVGTVIEANLDKGRGPVATVLVQNGSLAVGDAFVCGTTYGRVRAMYNHRGKKVKNATPSTAVEVIGMSDVAMAGDRFFAVNSDKEARKIADDRALEQKADELANSRQNVSLEDLFDQIQAGNIKTLNLILKADVHGSIEAIRQSLAKLKSDEVKINIQHANIGAITESDIMLATASNTIILGFNVRPSAAVIDLAKKEGVDIKTYRIIYELINDVEAALTGMLAPKYVERQLGEIDVRAIFKVPSVGTIAGAYVTSGKVYRSSNVRLLRNGVIIFEGKLSSLKRFKDDVREVAQGYECGVGIEGFNDVKEGDTIEVYEIDEVKQTL